MAETETGPEVGRVFQALEGAGNHCLLYLVTEETEDAPGALMEKMIDLIGWEGREFSQFPQELYSTEFIQRDLLIKAWGVGSTGAEVSGGCHCPEGKVTVHWEVPRWGEVKEKSLLIHFHFHLPFLTCGKASIERNLQFRWDAI